MVIPGATFIPESRVVWNRAGHLLHKTNPDQSYFELSYVFFGTQR